MQIAKGQPNFYLVFLTNDDYVYLGLLNLKETFP